MTKNLRYAYRFAPSPTGLLHVGGARTAIFNWLLARNAGAKFLLRIEDTDEKRSSQESLEQILSSMEWLNIKWDDKPIFQSKQKKRHKDVAIELLERKIAYRCFCTPQLLQGERKKAELNKKAFLYDGRCKRLNPPEINSNLENNIPFVLRLRLSGGETTFTDIVRGTVIVKHSELDDFVILRSDGSPVYHLAVVVDDHDMGITHVVRGDDHLSNTPKQILIHEALGWTIPNYAHVSLINGPDGARLSKRHGATAVEDFKKKGILPDALFNYLCLLGWSPGDDREVMTREEIVAAFSLDRVGKKDAVFDEKKLKWMNGKYLSEQSVDQILKLLGPYLDKPERDKILEDEAAFSSLIDLVKSRAQTVEEIYEGINYYFNDPETYEEKGVDKYFRDQVTMESLRLLMSSLKGEENFETDNLEKLIREFADQSGLKAGAIIHPLRLALTGRTTSPGIFDIMHILGRGTVIRRVERAFEIVSTLNENGPR